VPLIYRLRIVVLRVCLHYIFTHTLFYRSTLLRLTLLPTSFAVPLNAVLSVTLRLLIPVVVYGTFDSIPCPLPVTTRYCRILVDCALILLPDFTYDLTIVIGLTVTRLR